MKMRFFFLGVLLCVFMQLNAEERPFIVVETDDISLIYQVGTDGRLYQSYLGERLTNKNDYVHLPQGTEAYLTHGMEDYYEPALHVLHNDGNPSALLKYVSHEVNSLEEGVTETIIDLKDEQYPIEVKIHFVAYSKNNVIKEFTEILHHEKHPIILEKYASSMLHFAKEKYYLTEFTGDWAHEANMSETLLTFGKKEVDSKLGARANMFASPFFQLSFDSPSTENAGEVLVGTLGWTGNFRFTFEVDHLNRLRVISGINPYASQYWLPSGEVFRTPDFYFTYSTKGRGEASRRFHDWARLHQIKNGQDSRMTLLNNWEATYFDFDENKLLSLIKDAKSLGVDMFLLDDGWFGNKYPRQSDTQGLGDWQENAKKLPNGLGRLVEEAKMEGVKFGVWIEPEMVSPKSELYEKHKDWVIHLPNRDEYYFRNQLVLDLSNPEVQDYVFGVVDGLMTRYPGIAYFKWDCNSPITNIYSMYLKDKQTHLYIDYVQGYYNVLERIRAKYPDLSMMLCSGGGGRTDYEALRYYTEFWPSDNTDPIERLFIQWGYSQVFPSKVLCAHVTSWNKKASIKFRTDVAMMGKLGFDINLHELSEQEREFCIQAVRQYNEMKPIILDGDLYRLVSPYGRQHTSSMYVDKLKNKAVVFAFDIHPRYGEHLLPVCLDGLDPNKLYKVEEVNLMKGSKSSLSENGKVFSGNYLMTAGLRLFSSQELFSRIVKIEAL